MARTNTTKSRAPSQRQLRVGELLREALTETFARAPIRDPILAATAITVTEVRATADLKQARIFVMPLGGGDGAAVIEALRRAAPYLRSEVARRVKLRYAPALEFELDRSFDESSHIDDLLNQVSSRHE
ncbi:MAG: 30S ribosome-binding factor RbfA [Alphaproteobacteria bacterium]|jgi:ribosome-binding factor A|nr:30S ribosome-binding factor RbfA [Alphaproteobacteria bacterium]MDP6590340.1 30S ribosome-binding factor RbfA [Alphaproteobacteria bacterium]MDP6816420.1 30S ribosome-binding factor RbfA [Alphaproteobacteria bacterium]